MFRYFISTSDAQSPSFSTLGITSVSIRFREHESLYVSLSTPFPTHSAWFKRVRDGADLKIPDSIFTNVNQL